MDATGLVGEYRVDLPHALGLSASVRHDFNSDFRDVTTWRTIAFVAVSSRIESVVTNRSSDEVRLSIVK